ncbi:MAG: 16S rRNA (cytosine(1402)-N(4))-methyltransferase RsmH, partial [bacterium]|nr:16S rRNA (cytosine(1402)-N(4))-methyltransferase RsmH [bacterium]
PAEFFIDGTLGSAGHAVEIFKRILPGGKLLGIDVDENSLKIAQLKISTELRIKNSELRNNLILVQGNYANLPEILKKKNLPKADGLLLDLGISSEQLERSGRGFSFMRDEPLDMRYNQNQSEPASVVVNYYSEKELADIFFKYGEERFSRQIARKIIEERKIKPIKTTFDLVEIIQKAISFRRSRLHPATKVFQALRIYVNNELGNLEKLLKNLGKIIKNKGRAAIISYHSLEDRLVKNYFREMARQGKAKILTKKPIRPTLEEIRQNPRARSAKLRAIVI